jgi:hypothetical protein
MSSSARWTMPASHGNSLLSGRTSSGPPLVLFGRNAHPLGTPGKSGLENRSVLSHPTALPDSPESIVEHRSTNDRTSTRPPLELPYAARKAPRAPGKWRPRGRRRAAEAVSKTEISPMSQNHPILKRVRSPVQPRTMPSQNTRSINSGISMPNIIDFDSVERSLSASTHASGKKGRMLCSPEVANRS